MKDLLETLKTTDKKIARINLEIETTKESQYYNHFGNETERENDLQVLRNELRYHLSIKQSTLESMQIAINCELASISNFQRELTLKSA